MRYAPSQAYESAARSRVDYDDKSASRASRKNTRRSRGGGGRQPAVSGLIDALAALAWFKSKKALGNVGEDRYKEIADLMRKAEDRVAANGRSEWLAVIDLLNKEKGGATKSSLNAAVQAWLTAGGADTFRGAEKSLNRSTSLSKQDREQKMEFLSSFASMYARNKDAAERASIAERMKNSIGKYVADDGVKRLWSTGSFADVAPSDQEQNSETDAGSSPSAGSSRKTSRTQRRRQRQRQLDGRVDQAKVDASLQRAEELRGKVETTAGKVKKAMDGSKEHKALQELEKRIMKDARKYVSGTLLAGGKTMSAEIVNKEVAARFGGRQVVAKELEFGFLRMGRLSGSKEQALWHNADKEATNGTWNDMGAHRKIEFPKKAGAVTQFVAYSQEGGNRKVVRTLRHLEQFEKHKYSEIDMLVRKMDDMPDKWRKDLNSGPTTEKRRLAAVCELLYQTGYRVGSKAPSSGGQRTGSSGVGTIRIKHIVGVNRDSENVDFLEDGKLEGMQRLLKKKSLGSVLLKYLQKTRWPFIFYLNPAKHDGKDKKAMKSLVETISDGIEGANSPDDYVFPSRQGSGLGSARINRYIESLGLGITAHRMRGLKANRVFVESTDKQESLLTSLDKEGTDKKFIDVVIEAAEALNHARSSKSVVAGQGGRKILGNKTADWEETLKSYITPNSVRYFYQKTEHKIPRSVAARMGDAWHFSDEEVAWIKSSVPRLHVMPSRRVSSVLAAPQSASRSDDGGP